MKDSPEKHFNLIINTLTLLSDNDLLINYISPIKKTTKNQYLISWANHISGSFNCEKYFGRILQYKNIIKNNAYTCILFDGSIIRIAYEYNKNGLYKHSLLWWPAPFKIQKNDLELGGILDIFELYANDNTWSENIQMKSPIRFDYDSSNYSEAHPLSHLHIQSSDCRMYIDRPICFNKFIKFIFKNFYCDTYKSYKFFNELEEIKFDYIQEPSDKQVYITWSKS